MAVTFTFGLSKRDGAHGADHGRAAGHVVLHLLHAVGGLDGDAASVEGNALADQAQVNVCRRAGRIVAENNQRGRLVGALCDSPKRSHLQIFDLVRSEDFAAQADLGRHFFRALGEDGRGHKIGRFVDQIAGEILRLTDDPSRLQCVLKSLGIALREDGQGLDLLGFVVCGRSCSSPARSCPRCAFHDGANAIGGRDGCFRDDESEAPNIFAFERPHGGACELA